MTKTAKAPKNFYTATEAIRKLGMPRATFFNLAKSGKIKRVIPDGYTEGYYPKADIDKMALAREMFTLQYTSDSSIFRRAEEKDIQGITDLGVALFGTSTTPSYESRLACWEKNPDAYYVVEQDGLIVGWVALVPMKEEAITVLMGESKDATSMFVGMHQNVMVPENILPFTAEGAKNVFLTVGARQGLPRSKTYGMKLISGGYEVLENFARNGIIVQRLYATSRTPDGVKLCRDLGFQEKENNATSAVKRFWLDLETTDSPLLDEYQRIVKEYRQSHNEQRVEHGLLVEFYNQFRLQTNRDKILALAYWYEVRQAKSSFTSEEILVDFKEVKEPQPANIAHDMQRLVKKNFLLENGEVGNRTAYTLTDTGIKELKSKMFQIDEQEHSLQI